MSVTVALVFWAEACLPFSCIVICAILLALNCVFYFSGVPWAVCYIQMDL